MKPIDASRRAFLRQAASAALALAGTTWGARAQAAAPEARAGSREPWFRRTYRWGQTNLTEVDPRRFDLARWREHWKRTAVQGVVVNAGGITAYYPTAVPFHRRAEFLGERDLFGEILGAARADGLAVFARMDSNRAGEEFFRAHPNWFARDAEGRPYRVTDLHLACVNGPYYDEYMPAVLREIANRYRPEGFTDNNWNGPMRHQPCFCDNCERLFRARTGAAIPRQADWNDRLYREWIRWNYERRLEIWDRFNAVTREAGGPNCIWVGMVSGSVNWEARAFRDDREIFRRAALVMLDHQRRHDESGFPDNGEAPKRIRSAGGWDKLVPESIAMYHLGDRNFRLAAKPEPEVRLWALEGIAGGVQPWWHVVGGVQEDRRMLETAVPLWNWHREHERYLVDRTPVAEVGLVWAQQNQDFFGRDEAGALVDEPWNGWRQALVRARIPYVPVHAEDIATVAAAVGLKVLILPNVAALSERQVQHIRRFVAGGGSLIATGLSSLCDEWGEVRRDLALADLLGVHLPAGHGGRDEANRTTQAKGWAQTYLRLPAEADRHETLAGLKGTDLIAFGGMLEPLAVDAGAVVPLTFVPPVPVMPVEAVWMREPRTSIPGLVLRETTGGGRVAYLPADLDRRFARDHLPDHGNLLANLVRWAAREALSLQVEGPGLVDCHLYRQPGRLILHLVNLTNAGTWRSPVHELVPVGEQVGRILTPEGFDAGRVSSLVSGTDVEARTEHRWVTIRLPQITDHEVVVVELRARRSSSP